MIFVFFTPSPSSTKALNFFRKNNFRITEVNLLKSPIEVQQIRDILSLTTNGFEDITVHDARPIREANMNLEDLTFNQMVHWIQHEPIVLKKTIILQYKNNKPYRLMIGFNKSDIKIFLRDSEEYTNDK